MSKSTCQNQGLVICSAWWQRGFKNSSQRRDQSRLKISTKSNRSVQSLPRCETQDWTEASNSSISRYNWRTLKLNPFCLFLTSQKRTRHFPGVDSIIQRTQNQNQSSRTQLSLFFWELLDYFTVWIVKKGCHNHQSANQSDKSEDFTQRSRPKTGSRKQARICQLYNELKVKCALL